MRLLLAAKWLQFSGGVQLTRIKELVQQLEQLAVQEHGSFEYDVPDYKFSEIIPEELEDEVLSVMLSSDRWIRGTEGFFYKNVEEF